jgi:hypothetical protein
MQKCKKKKKNLSNNTNIPSTMPHSNRLDLMLLSPKNPYNMNCQLSPHPIVFWDEWSKVLGPDWSVFVRDPKIIPKNIQPPPKNQKMKFTQLFLALGAIASVQSKVGDEAQCQADIALATKELTLAGIDIAV